MPTSAEMTLLDTDLTLAGGRLATAVEIALENDAAALRYQETVQAWKLERSLDRGVKNSCASAAP